MCRGRPQKDRDQQTSIELKQRGQMSSRRGHDSYKNHSRMICLPIQKRSRTQLKRPTESLVHRWIGSKNMVDLEGHYAIDVLSTRWLIRSIGSWYLYWLLSRRRVEVSPAQLTNAINQWWWPCAAFSAGGSRQIMPSSVASWMWAPICTVLAAITASEIVLIVCNTTGRCARTISREVKTCHLSFMVRH